MLIHFVFIRDTEVVLVYIKMQNHNTLYIHLLSTSKNWQRMTVINGTCIYEA